MSIGLPHEGESAASNRATEMKATRMKTRAVSLAELVIAIIILGVLAAMAIPNLSAGATHGPEDQLRSELVRLRTAIDLYYADHGAYPGQQGAETPAAGAGSPVALIRQLTQYSDAGGQTSPTPSEVFCYGPYLRDGIPRCPVAPATQAAGVHLIDGTTQPARCDAAAGWIYNYRIGIHRSQLIRTGFLRRQVRHVLILDPPIRPLRGQINARARQRAERGRVGCRFA